MTTEEQTRSEAVIAAPGTIVLGGRTFLCEPPSVSDHQAFRKELRRQVQAAMSDPIELANQEISLAERAGTPLSPTMAKFLAEAAFAAKSKGGKTEPTDAQIVEQAMSAEGIRWWAWYILRKADPALAPEFVMAHIKSDEDAFAISHQLAELAQLRKLVPKSPTPTG